MSIQDRDYFWKRDQHPTDQCTPSQRAALRRIVHAPPPRRLHWSLKLIIALVIVAAAALATRLG
jgi:hypothetical protein